MALLSAGDVKLVDPLKDPLTGINKRAQGSLQAALGRLQGQSLASSRASGRISGSYIPQELNRASTMGSRGIEDTLYGGLGGASLKDMLAAQEHQRNLELVNEIGGELSPSILQQIFGGLGAAGQAGAGISSIYSSLNKKQPTNTSIYPGYAKIPDFGYGQQYPSMMRRGY